MEVKMARTSVTTALGFTHINRMIMDVATMRLASGASMPSVGLGLWKVERQNAARTVEEAIRIGYRHFDSAYDYGNEVESGIGLQESMRAGLCKREELWITSKLWNTYHRREHVRPAVERTLRDLGLDHLDLYLVHFPIPQVYVPLELRYPPGWFNEVYTTIPVAGTSTGTMDVRTCTIGQLSSPIGWHVGHSRRLSGDENCR